MIHHPMKTGLTARLFLLLSVGWVGAMSLPLQAEETDADTPVLTLHTWHEPHMGTVFTIRVWASDSRKTDAENAVAAAFKRVEELNSIYSDYLPDSELSRLSRSAPGQPINISGDLYRLLLHSQNLSRSSGGAFDVTVGPLIRLWRLSRKNSRLPDSAQLNDAFQRSGHEKLVLDESAKTATLRVAGMQIDLGGIAKGHAADTALAILRDAGFPQALIAASGDIAVGDPPPGKTAWRVGIRGLAPSGEEDSAGEAAEKLPADLTGLIELNDAAISTSGDLNQSIEIDGVRYSHIVDPRTGLGLIRRRSVTVIAPTGTESDSLATACSVLAADAALALIQDRGAGYHIQIRELDENGKLIVHQSKTFPPMVSATPATGQQTPE